MKKSIIFILIFFLIIVVSFLIFLLFLWWNDNPKLNKKSNPPIAELSINSIKNQASKNLKIASYNIHFGIGLDIKTKEIDEASYIKRLNSLASVIKNLDADIILLQEVDFHSKRSFFIDEANFIAKKAGYKYIAEAPTLKRKLHIFYNFVCGKLDYGICILSKYPIETNELVIFDYSKEIPFYIKWLFDPHGAQKCTIDLNGKKLEVVNLHLDPWSQLLREEQIKLIKNLWLDHSTNPKIVAGDFNTISYYDKSKKGLSQQDAPWFVDRKNWNLKNEKTLKMLLNMGFQDAFAVKLFLTTKTLFTYPADKPKEKIDHILTENTIKIIRGIIFDKAKTASDHLPVCAEVKID
ncbi:MAG: endonuclease/exonuclease/phosphatase family protein [Parachlamydiales bacterium]|jgi:endonuclease/exonuclease/phosphatase family metal-dependent hydrolase